MRLGKSHAAKQLIEQNGHADGLVRHVRSISDLNFAWTLSGKYCRTRSLSLGSGGSAALSVKNVHFDMRRQDSQFWSVNPDRLLRWQFFICGQP